MLCLCVCRTSSLKPQCMYFIITTPYKMSLWCDLSQETYKRFCTKPTECAFLFLQVCSHNHIFEYVSLWCQKAKCNFLFLQVCSHFHACKLQVFGAKKRNAHNCRFAPCINGNLGHPNCRAQSTKCVRTIQSVLCSANVTNLPFLPHL